ncbi:glycine--tRNA ligase subunit beta [Pendulispora albinea]|uniref:Glycine--tRNA ligase beta subunit n=1 Tax=Pendulispora albinea TaxID=2741071 RepID=A0ABZ2LQA5_9BACT
MTRPTLLLEIGVEELPSSFVDAALAALPNLVREKLGQLRLEHGNVYALGTARRLAVLVHELSPTQTSLDEEVIGPPEAAAFKDGKPTRAAEAFAAKLGVSVEALSIVEKAAGPKQKPGRYVVARRQEQGREATSLLGAAVAEICASIPFRKSMRWGSGDVTFARPVQWLVVLLGDQVIDATFAGVRSDRKTFGHRFLAPAALSLEHADGYVDALRSVHVLVDRDERARTMMDGVARAARELGGTHDPDPALVDENASLVEEPHTVVGSFSPDFLALPAPVIRAVARGHQKYFCVQKNEEELLPHYLAVVNTANRPDKVALGNDRVMRARLSDAQFFFGEDKKTNVEARVEKLGGIVFVARLGTVREKVARFEALAARIAERLGLSADAAKKIQRAAHLSKNDLVSLMVGEFPELQGTMGRAYAQGAGEDPEVCDAIRDHYRPVGADDRIAPSDVARVIALADRLDTLVGCFAIGLSPTGTADPYALRRACIAVLRILIESAEESPAWGELHFGELVGLAYDLYTGKKLDATREETIAKVSEFGRERLRNWIATRTSSQVADAVLTGHAFAAGVEAPIEGYPYFAMAKARALQAVVSSGASWLEKARTVAKRLNGISKDAAPILHPKEGFAASSKDATIHDVVCAIDTATASLKHERAVESALHQAEDLAQRIDEIFVTTLVNDPNDPNTKKRLELLSYGAKSMLRIGDFSKLG